MSEPLVKTNVLDDGYVALIQYMGSDLIPVNAARASFAKSSSFEENGELKEADKKLIWFLATNGHTSPFRHAALTFEFRAPIFVARQHWKYVVGSTHGPSSEDREDFNAFLDQLLGQEGEGFDTAWNETSGRYVTQDWKFHVPYTWRTAPASRKQGSGPPIAPMIGRVASDRLRASIKQGLEDYEWALHIGICAEQARLFLNYAGLFTNYYWTASLQAVCWFLIQRHPNFEGGHAQKEIQEYARAVYDQIIPLFPESVKAMTYPYTQKVVAK